MTIRDVKKIMCMLFMFGFFAGILYVNIFAKPAIISMGIFSDYFLEQYSSNRIDTGTYIWHITKIRILPVILLAIPANTGIRKLIAVVFLLWTGFSTGLIFTTAIMKIGIAGIGLCIVGILPHFICYVTALVMLLIYVFAYPDVRWNSMKTTSICLFLMLGIVTEVYINPVLMDIYIQIL